MPTWNNIPVIPTTPMWNHTKRMAKNTSTYSSIFASSRACCTFHFRWDPVAGRAIPKRREDPMKNWSEERKILEAEKLANTIERGIR